MAALTYRMPLPAGDLGDLEEQPLTGGVLETGLHDTQFHSTCKSKE